MSGDGRPIRSQAARAAPAVPLSMSEYVTAALREQILDGERPLGSRLDQRRLAEEFGVSVVPLREGLQRLEAEGLVELHARRGAFVRTPGAEELRELSTIRQLLDPLASEKAAERMSDATLTHLSELLEDMRRETERADFNALSRVDREFHLSIYEQADMPILVQLITNLKDRYAIVSRLCMEMPDYSSRSLREHEQIYEACCARAPQLAGDLMRQHLSFALNTLLDFLPSLTTSE